MDTALAFAAELEQRDAALAGRLAILVELGRRVDAIRTCAEHVGGFLARLPRDREQLDATLAESERDLDAARTELAEARHAVERARGVEATATAHRREANASTDVQTTAERHEQLAARRNAVDLEETAAITEIRSLDATASELAAELAATPRLAPLERPGAGLDGLLDWGSRVRAAVFVTRSGLEAERERVVREANELAASVLGEPLYATSVAVARKRLVERLS